MKPDISFVLKTGHFSLANDISELATTRPELVKIPEFNPSRLTRVGTSGIH